MVEISPLLRGSTKKSARAGVVAAAVAASCLVVVLVASSGKQSAMLQMSFAPGAPILKALNPGLRSGADKDPDDPWGYLTPRCRGLATCSSSTSSPAVKHRQNALRMAHGVNRQQQQQQQQRRVVSMAQKAEPIDAKRGLSMTEQYAKIMQNKGYFAPWSRENGWVDRVAIDNIRKANTPQALAERRQMIEKENAKFAKEFSSPHTSQYTGTHQSLSDILDPKFQPWANDGPRKAYYAGF